MPTRARREAAAKKAADAAAALAAPIETPDPAAQADQVIAEAAAKIAEEGAPAKPEATPFGQWAGDLDAAHKDDDAKPEPAPRAPRQPAKPGGKMSVTERIGKLVEFAGEFTGGSFTRKDAAERLGCSETVIGYTAKDAAPKFAEAGLTVTYAKGAYTVTAA